MQIYFHSRLCSYLLRVPILVKGTVKCCMYIKRVHLKGSLDTKFPFPTSCLNINVCTHPSYNDTNLKKKNPLSNQAVLRFLSE